MIQLNLLPNLKLEYVKAQRSKRLVSSISIVISLIALGLLTVFFLYNLYQKHTISHLNSSITNNLKTLKNEKDINKILTLQNQLDNLTPLHSAKPNTANIFSYLNQVTPAQATISNTNLDFNQKTIVISGKADTVNTVNQYVDTLKLTTYKIGKDQPNDAKNAFSNVVLAGFSIGNGQVTYTINLSFDPVIFDITKDISLSVPNTTTTRLLLNNPTDLFSAQSQKTLNQGGQ